MLFMKFESVLGPVRELLQAAEIDYRLLKGLATAQLDYAQPEYRRSGDIDILIRKTHVIALEEAFADLGWTMYPYAPGLIPLVTEKGITYVSPTGAEVDVHTRIFGQTKQAEETLFELSESTRSGDPCLAPAGRLVHAAGHALLSRSGHRRLSSLVDCSVLLHRTGVDFDEVARLSKLWRVERVVNAALEAESVLSGMAKQLPEIETRRRFGLDPVALVAIGPRRRLDLEYYLKLRNTPPRAWAGLLLGRLAPQKGGPGGWRNIPIGLSEAAVRLRALRNKP